jgi:hypothetical protein
MKYLICFALTALAAAQVPRNETLLRIKDRAPSQVVRQELSSGTLNIFNSAAARRIGLSSAGGLSTTTGIVEVLTGASGSEAMRARLDSVGLRTTGALRLESTGGYFEWLPNPALAANVSLQAPATMDSGCLYHDGAGVTSFQPCSTGSFVTLDTAQTITGAKIFKNAITIEDALSATDRSVLGSGTLQLYTTGGHSRVTLSSSSSVDSGTGIVRVLTGAPGLESTVAEMSAGGVNVNSPASYKHNGASGVSSTCSTGQYPAFFSASGGLVMNFTCTALPSAGGDMLLGTAQTVTALKTFQTTFGGDAIRVNNTSSQLRGTWSDATLRIGDIASGFGRGIQLSTGGTFTIFTATSQTALSLSFSGSTTSTSVLEAGTSYSGLTQVCITTAGGQIKFVGGFAVSCF